MEQDESGGTSGTLSGDEAPGGIRTTAVDPAMTSAEAYPRLEAIASPLARRPSTAGYRALGGALPADDAELDRFFDYLTNKRAGNALVSALIAALDAGRKVDARHLAAAVPSMEQDMQIPCVALRCVGDVDAALLAGERQERASPLVRATCLLAASLWRQKNRAEVVFDDIAARFPDVQAAATNDQTATIVLAAACEFLQQSRYDRPWSKLASAPVVAARSRGRAHLEKMESFIARPLLDPVEAAEYSHHPKPVKQTVKLDAPKVGRNEPCPCGSGRKYKKCCLGKNEAEP